MKAVTVEFRISAQGRSSPRSHFAVLELEPSGEPNNNLLARETQTLRVPIGRSISGEKLSLWPGHYLARVRFPSGEQFNELIEVRDAEAQQKIMLGARKPRSRTKNHYAEDLPVPSVFKQLIDYDLNIGEPSLSREVTSHRENIPLDFQVSYSSPTFDQGLTSMSAAETWLAPVAANLPLTEFLRATWAGEVGLSNYPRTRAEVEIASCVGNYDHLFEFISTADTNEKFTARKLLDAFGLHLNNAELRPTQISKNKSRVLLHEGDHNETERVAGYAVVSSVSHRSTAVAPAGQKVKLIRLPGKWLGQHDGRPRDVFVEITKSRWQQFEIALSVDDPQIQSVIDFSQQNDLRGALAVLDQGVDMLFRKVVNPYAAAAAAYVLLLAPPNLVPPEWHDWVGNLARWFPDLPDGAIQHATLLLQRPPPNEVRANLSHHLFPEHSWQRSELAAMLVLESLQRGLPLYRSGFSLLASNLDILSQDTDLPGYLQDSIRTARKMVSALQLRLDTSQPFTVVDISIAA